jgi:uncharacterized repeat protein (TIGR03803 family)
MNMRLPPSSPRRWLTSICIGVVSVAGLLAVSNEASAQLHDFDVLHTFPPAGPSNPYVGLIQATDGNFYGTTSAGGAPGYGTLYQITPSGTLTVLHAFTYNEGRPMPEALVQATDGNLYGTVTCSPAIPPLSPGVPGIPAFPGAVFKITMTGTVTFFHTFSPASEGEHYTARCCQRGHLIT